MKTLDCGDFVKRERNPSPEAMELDCEMNRVSDQSRSAMRNSRHPFPSSAQQQQQQGHVLQPGPVTNGRQTSGEFQGRKTSADLLRNLISPEFPSQTGTPTSFSQLIPSGFSSSEGNDFVTPMGSAGRLTPQTADRISRKRALSISPLSSSSLDLNSLIRTSPTSLVSFITNNSRGSSAGSISHLSPSLGLFGNVHQQPHSRPMQVSLRSGNYPVNNSNAHHSISNHQGSEFAAEVNSGGITIKKEIETSPPSQHCSSANSVLQNQESDIMKMEDIRDSLFDGCNVNVKMEPDNQENSFFPPPLIPLGLGGGGLETVQEEPGGIGMSDDEDFMHSDPTDYSAIMNSNEFEYDTKPELGILESSGDHDRQKRIYYSYPSVEEPHNNQCRWSECSMQCENLDGLVQHVNSDHIYRDSKKEFVCNWVGCVRERKPFKAQYMLLVHMRRHTGEKPHKCTVSSRVFVCVLCVCVRLRVFVCVHTPQG